jgi:hypothetical protein
MWFVETRFLLEKQGFSPLRTRNTKGAHRITKKKMPFFSRKTEFLWGTRKVGSLSVSWKARSSAPAGLR